MAAIETCEDFSIRYLPVYIAMVCEYAYMLLPLAHNFLSHQVFPAVSYDCYQGDVLGNL